MLREEVLPKVQKSLKKTIDEMLDLELANMRLLMGVKAKKGKKKKGKGKKKKGKKSKGPKLPGAKYLKGMTEFEMLIELVKNQIVKRLPPAHLKDFLGEFNYIASMMDDPKDTPRPPSMALIRQLVTEYIIFPLGSALVRKRHPEEVRSVLFYGPAGTGKTQVVRSVATETRAIVYDLSAIIVKDVYNADKKESEKMVAMVMMSAKKYAPSLIYIDECEKIFAGKKKKAKRDKKKPKKPKDPHDPVRIKKVLLKWKAKWITDETRITVIGCTSEPQEGSKKDFKKFFDKAIYFPFPDYTTRRLMWKTFIEDRAKFKLPPEFPLSTLAHISEGYSAGSIKTTCEKVLTMFR
jgi:SpoVK/Ycf46/Vps4 family AAA+-type ATPase